MTVEATTKKTPRFDCTECNGTGHEIVFGDPCVCLKIPISGGTPLIELDLSAVTVADIAAATHPAGALEEFGGVSVDPEITAAAKELQDEARAKKKHDDWPADGGKDLVAKARQAREKKRLTPREHFAAHKGDLIPGAGAIRVGSKVRSHRDGVEGIALCAHAQYAKDFIDSQHYGKVKVLLPSGDVTTRTYHTLTILKTD
jgi:hypothetical protein